MLDRRGFRRRNISPTLRWSRCWSRPSSHSSCGAEWTYNVSGLPIPGDRLGEAEAESYAALRLFAPVCRARPAGFRPDRAPDRRDPHLPAGSGLPLAIEICASWVERLTPAQIAAEISVSSSCWTPPIAACRNATGGYALRSRMPCNRLAPRRTGCVAAAVGLSRRLRRRSCRCRSRREHPAAKPASRSNR